MYPLLLAVGLFVSITLSLALHPKEPAYFLGPLFGLLAALPAFVIVTRLIARRVYPYMEKTQRLVKAGNVAQAIECLEEARRYKNWQLFLDGQINTQIGVLHYSAGNNAKAIEHLVKGYPRLSEGPTILATLLYRANKKDEALKTLEHGVRFNKKSPIVWNLLAWMLDKENKRDEAIAVLVRAVKKLPRDEETADNLDRLRNRKRMNMSAFGDLWYMLKFEHPPGADQSRPVRKGFRQPPKQKQKRSRV